MISTKSAFIVAIVGSFVAGSFFASPELRAYASTIANDVICSSCVGTSDLAGNAVTGAKIKDGEVKTAELGSNSVTAAKIKDGEVKAAEIATDAVGAAELQGVTKLLFARCNTDSFVGFTAGEGSSFSAQCVIAGVDQSDNVLATLTSTGTNVCWSVLGTQAGTGLVNVRIMNMCPFSSTFGAGSTISIIVYDK